MSSPSSILIVGAGQAAAVAVAALRGHGYSGRISLVGDEAHPPYERPPLSKDLLVAASPDTEPAISVKPAGFYEESQVDLKLGLSVTHLDTNGKVAALSDGSTVGFDKCLLATGGLARTLPDFPETAPNVFYLRTLDDARHLRAAMQPGKHVVIIGAGFLGLEIASTALGKGLTASVIEYAPRALARVVPPEFSGWLEAQAARAGATLHLGQAAREVVAPAASQGAWQLTLNNGTVLSADLVVVAVGLTANTALARDASLSVDTQNGGIVVDSQCRTSHGDIFAAGDCTSQIRDASGAGMRLESWQNANEQARIAAAAMLGETAEPAAYPWFWTDQFGHNIQMLGLPQAGLRYVTRGDTSGGATPAKFIMVGLLDNIPVHAIAVNAGGDLRALRPVFESRLAIDPSQFTDTLVTVRAFAKQVLAQATSVSPA
ncbi:ferredoxin reductase [Pusillimonas sp. T2]|uniref:NAD(P)/FAD-dependent oxidoreductase n=1 Tax=Pusillimonas sp. T2 TaxID=1548123 RepID=UPI000B9CA01C|nr:FAD-dependent oxidoreductase [Pusillimonas sp. T2]OXR48277.1 ferredoxin reductase [Pusillimonas sp. T2]